MIKNIVYGVVMGVMIFSATVYIGTVLRDCPMDNGIVNCFVNATVQVQ